jgi:hypothetical protein
MVLAEGVTLPAMSQCWSLRKGGLLAILPMVVS